jgi:hypothetical protein
MAAVLVSSTAGRRWPAAKHNVMDGRHTPGAMFNIWNAP